MLVEQLFQLVSCNLPESMWNHLFNTPNHLTSFLRLFTDSFHIQSNIVTLIQHPKICQKLTENIYNLNTVKKPSPPIIEQPAPVVEIEKPRPKSPEKEILSPINPRKKLKVTSVNDRLKNARMNNKTTDAEIEKKMEENAEKNEDEKPKGVSFRLGKYNSKNREENNDARFGQIQNDYNGEFSFFLKLF